MLIDEIKNLCLTHNEFSSWGLTKDLFSIARSVSGMGNLTTLEKLKEFTDGALEIKYFNSASYYSWEVPKYWKFRSANISSIEGEKLISTEDNLLHVLTHSIPFKGRVSKEELRSHLFYEEGKERIPYRTSYYKDNWGFCVTQSQYDELMTHEFVDIDIDSELENAPVPYGEAVFEGVKTNKEILVSSYICHPAMANNELSGILLLARLIKIYDFISKTEKLPVTLRFLLIPETIGAIAYIAENHARLLSKNVGTVVCSCVGDGRELSLVKGKNPRDFYDALFLCASKVAAECDLDFREYSFLERGSDERQFSSPGVDLDVAAFCNSKFGSYPEYHSSEDNLSVISEDAICKSSEVVIRALNLASENTYPCMKDPCEPMLGRFGLYPHTRDYESTQRQVMNLLNFSAYADGDKSLATIARLTEMSDIEILDLFKKFKDSGVLK